jgi:hypothetical protein
MRVLAHVRDQILEVQVGEGNQRIKWLAMVALQRYDAAIGERLSMRHVAVGLETLEGDQVGRRFAVRDRAAALVAQWARGSFIGAVRVRQTRTLYCCRPAHHREVELHARAHAIRERSLASRRARRRDGFGRLR